MWMILADGAFIGKSGRCFVQIWSTSCCNESQASSLYIILYLRHVHDVHYLSWTPFVRTSIAVVICIHSSVFCDSLFHVAVYRQLAACSIDAARKAVEKQYSLRLADVREIIERSGFQYWRSVNWSISKNENTPIRITSPVRH